jgi:Fe-S cluster biogenesis protein NfuA
MMRDEVEAALEPIRHQIRADGGDIELLDVDGRRSDGQA